MNDREGRDRAVLVFHANERLCALSAECVDEVMRPLLCEQIAGVAPFVTGVSIVRGRPTPIVDAGVLIASDPIDAPARLIVARGTEAARPVGLLVSGVLGLERVDAETFEPLPPLLSSGEADRRDALGRLDGALVRLLERARYVPDELWAQMARGGAR